MDNKTVAAGDIGEPGDVVALFVGDGWSLGGVEVEEYRDIGLGAKFGGKASEDTRNKNGSLIKEDAEATDGRE